MVDGFKCACGELRTEIDAVEHGASMRFVATFVTALVGSIAIPPVALAQRDGVECARFRTLIEAGPSGLAAYRGNPLPSRPDIIQSTFVPHGFANCAIVASPVVNMICHSGPLTQAGAALLYGFEMSGLRHCLVGWNSMPISTSPDRPLPEPPPGVPGLLQVEGTDFTRRSGDVEIKFSLLLSRQDATEPAAHMVGFGFTWRTMPLGS